MASLFENIGVEGLLGKDAKRRAALDALTTLTSQIGARSAPRLTPGAPPLDLNAVNQAYNNSVKNSLSLALTAQKIKKDQALKDLFAPKKPSEEMVRMNAAKRARTMAERSINRSAVGDELSEDLDLFQAQKEVEFYPAMEKQARQQLTMPDIANFVQPAQREAFIAFGGANPEGALKLLPSLIKDNFSGSNKTAAIKNFEYLQKLPEGDRNTLQALAGAGVKTTNLENRVRFDLPDGTSFDVPKGLAKKDQPEIKGQQEKQKVLGKSSGDIEAQRMPGSKQNLDSLQRSKKQDKSITDNVQQSRVILDALDGIDMAFRISSLGDDNVVGTLSIPASKFSKSAAGLARSYLKQLQSPIVLSAMMRLKEASAQGATGFGQMNIRELETLINSLGQLDADTSDATVIKSTVNRIRKQFETVMSSIRRELSPKKIEELGLTDLVGKSPSSEDLNNAREALRKGAKIKDVINRFKGEGFYVNQEMLRYE